MIAATPLLLTLFACKGVEPAPEDLDGLAHYYWRHFDDERDDALAQGAANLHEAVDGDLLSEVVDGSLSRLDVDELALVDRGDEDATLLAGVYLVNVVSCPLEELERQSWAPNQDELHPGTYVSYDRVFTSDLDAFEAGEVDLVTWDSTYEVKGFQTDYSALIHGWLRRVPDRDGTSPWGTVLVERGVLDEPAMFGDSDERGMYQDYQLQVYYERAPGETVHLYAIWREMIYLAGTDFSSETVQRFVLNGLADWDEDAEGTCGGE